MRVRLSASLLLTVATMTLAIFGLMPSPFIQTDQEERIVGLETEVADLDAALGELDDRVTSLERPAAAAAAADEDSDDEADDAGANVAPARPSASSAEGTRTNPIPVGETAQVGEWSIRVTDVIPDATQVVLSENQFNDPPPSGSQFFLITLEATYLGADSEEFFWAFTWSGVGQSSTAYGESEHSCGSLPNGMSGVPEVFQGGTIDGQICFTVRSEDVASLVVYIEPLSSDERVFFAVRDGN